jgi:hypothetical protein
MSFAKRPTMPSCALLFGLALSSAALVAQEPSNRPGGLQPRAVTDGTMDIQVVNGCFAFINGTVDTTAGTNTAFINTWDDGTFKQSFQLDFPSSPGTFPYCLVFQQPDPVLQGAAGLGVYLENGAGPAATETFDADGSLDISNVCTGPAPVCPETQLTQEIPALNPYGVAALTLLLAGGAVAILVRRSG